MEIQRVRDLIGQQRWAALATQGDSGPIASQDAYAIESDFSGFLLHLSRLAAHTRALLIHPAVSLSIAEPDDGREDPQTLARATLFGQAAVLDSKNRDYPAARQHYLERFPAAEQLFAFSDFYLIRVMIAKARYVGGFGAAITMDRATLRLSTSKEH